MEKLISPGLAFASAISSAKLFTGTLGCTDRIWALKPAHDTGAKDFTSS